MSLDKLQALREYLQRTRGVGHTRALVRGANYEEGVLVLGGDMTGAARLRETIGPVNPTAEFLAWSALQPWMLQGYERPLLLDNQALEMLVHDALLEIDLLRRELGKARRELQEKEGGV